MTETHQSKMLEALQGLLCIQSVKSDPIPGAPFGAGIQHALEYTLSLADAMGFQTKNIDGYAGYIDIRAR